MVLQGALKLKCRVAHQLSCHHNICDSALIVDSVGIKWVISLELRQLGGHQIAQGRVQDMLCGLQSALSLVRATDKTLRPHVDVLRLHDFRRGSFHQRRGEFVGRAGKLLINSSNLSLIE